MYARLEHPVSRAHAPCEGRGRERLAQRTCSEDSRLYARTDGSAANLRVSSNRTVSGRHVTSAPRIARAVLRAEVGLENDVIESERDVVRVERSAVLHFTPLRIEVQ